MNRLKLVFCVCLILAFLSGCAAQTDSSPEVPKPEDTHWLWVEGKKLASGPVWNGVSYCKLSELAACCGGSFDDGPDLTLTAWEHTLRFKRGTGTVSADGITVHLDVPCLCYEGEWYAPAAELMTLLGLDELEDPELKQSFYSFIPCNDAIPAGVPVVVLRYHCVSDDIWGIESLFMSPASVEEQIRAMLDMGCTLLTFEDLDKIDQYEKPVFMTFDDGYEDNYTELFPILKKYNVKATIFVISGKVGQPYYLTEAQIKEMSDSGLVSIQSHTVSHGDVRTMTPEQKEYEAAFSQLSLARITGKIPFALSFPRATADDESMACVMQYYQYVVIADGYQYVTGTDPYRIPRFVMPRDLTLEQFLLYFD